MISTTRVFAFVLLYIHSFSFFIALAAPVPVTQDVSPAQGKREHDNGLYMRQKVQSMDARAVLGAPAAAYLRTKSRYALTMKASAEREPAALVARGFFSNIGNAFKKVGGAIKGGFQKAGNAIKNVAKKVGNGAKNVAQKVGNGVKNVAKKVGGGIKNVVNKVGNGVKNVANGVKKVAQKVGNDVKNVANKVGNGVKNIGNGVKNAAKAVGNGVKTAGKWVKANGAKIAKGGLKVLATVGSVASRVANLVPIPGVGKLMSKGLGYASKGLDKASNAIKADMGAFGKASSVMDKIQNPLSGAGGQALDAIL
jgi:hypothetical protein